MDRRTAEEAARIVEAIGARIGVVPGRPSGWIWSSPPTSPSRGRRALLERHLAFAREVTPAGHVHALDLDGLLDPS